VRKQQVEAGYGKMGEVVEARKLLAEYGRNFFG